MASRRKREAAAAAAAAAAPVRKPLLVRYLMVAGVALLALIVAFVVVTAFARQTGLQEQHLNYALAVAALLIGIVTTRSIKSLRKRSAAGK